MRWGVVLALVWCAGCTADRTFTCAQSSDCVRSGVDGQCLAPGFCVFGDDDCESGMRWDSTASSERADACVDAGEPDGEEANACGGRTLLVGAVGDACGICSSGLLACDGPEALACAGEAMISEPLSPEGSAASSIYDGTFISSMAIDGDLTTSWFSSGVEDDGTSVFTWIGGAEECIGRVEFDGNAMHAEPEYREGYGHEKVTVRVVRGNGEVVFSQEQDLTGTPDEPFDMDVGVIGRDVELVFEEPEDPSCGGFSELRVFSLR